MPRTALTHRMVRITPLTGKASVLHPARAPFPEPVITKGRTILKCGGFLVASSEPVLPISSGTGVIAVSETRADNGFSKEGDVTVL